MADNQRLPSQRIRVEGGKKQCYLRYVLRCGEFAVYRVFEGGIFIELDLELGAIGGKLRLVGHVEVVPQVRL